MMEVLLLNGVVVVMVYFARRSRKVVFWTSRRQLNFIEIYQIAKIKAATVLVAIVLKCGLPSFGSRGEAHCPIQSIHALQLRGCFAIPQLLRSSQYNFPKGMSHKKGN